MAIVTNWFATDDKPGVDLNNVQTSVDVNTAPETPLPRFALGDRVQGQFGSEWCFVVASATVSAFNMITINRNYGAVNLTSAQAVSNCYVYGNAQFQPRGGVTTGNANGGVANPGDNFWALMKWAQGARLNITASVSVAFGAKLYISPTIPGFLTTSATLGQMIGVSPVVSASGGGDVTVVEAACYTYPFLGILISVPPVSLTA